MTQKQTVYTNQWNELVAGVEAALDEDPASPIAQALAARWRKLLQGFTGGVNAVMSSFSRRQARYPESMRAARVIAGVLTSICLVAVAKADAQVGIGATLGLSTQGDGASDQPYLGPPFGGTSVAMLGLVDAAIAPRVTIGGEVSLAGTISGTQSQRASLGASNNFVSEHRDNVFSGVVKFWTPDRAPVRAAVAVGAGFAERHTVRLGTTRSTFPPFASTPFSDTLSDVVLAYTFGGDIIARVTDRLGLLMSGRLYELQDNDRQPDGVVHRGVSSTILRYGIGAQIRF